MWAAIGELLFTVVVSYMGAIELLFVAKQLYHLAFQHQQRQMLLSDDSSLRRLQDQVEHEIAEATEKEVLGFNAMKDGVLYKDGFRIDPGEINEHEKLQRQVIGGSKTSLEREDQEPLVDVTPSFQKLPSESECVEEVVEEPCVKKHVERFKSSRQEIEESKPADDKRTNITQTIKTQISQTNVEDYSPAIEIQKSGLSPIKSEEPFSNKSSTQEPLSIQTQTFSPLSPQMRFDEYEREEPEGQDVPEPQYSDEYLRSLDGIKIRPLVRDDGSGRRRAFKKRRSSESTSSRESRASREEELKMFTSLEEEEFESIRRGDSDYIPIRYSSDPNLLKIGKHQRRHKKSPIKDSSHLETEGSKGSLEMLDEENSSPWGDIKPEHYKDSEFWKREKAVSIDEEGEENAHTWNEDIQKEQAGQVTASPSPTKNIPKLSSFEQATPSQHESAVSNLSLQNIQDKAKKLSEHEDVENVSSDVDSQAEQLLASYDQKASAETEENVACNKPHDKAEETGLRRSPRLDDMDHYEEYLREQENENMRALSPPAQPSQNNDFSNSQLTEFRPEITSASSSIDEQNFSAIPSNTDEISSTLGMVTLRGVSPRKLDRPKTPVIEIEPVSDDSNNTCNEPSNDVNIVSESGLLDGISDFYDFNASINPSRSPSVERSAPKSRSPSRCSQETSEERKLPGSSQPITDTLPLREGLSDFYDFNIMINQHAYGYDKSDHKVHRSTTDYLAEKLKDRKSRSKSPLPAFSLPKNEDLGLREEGGGTRSFEETPSPLDTPETPEYQRTLSANMRYIESMRENYIQEMYKRSRYVGESMDFENDFEELREQTRHFRRSRSKSRSPIPNEGEPSTSRQAALAEARRELQDRILAEITRTTINYQDFSHDFNKPYMDFDRRVSDSALIQKPELMIQIEDQCKERKRNVYDYDDDDDTFEAEEYLHFRRFSLNQEHQIEEYPEDYMYMEQIDVQTNSGTRSWTRKDYHDAEMKQNLEDNSEISITTSDITEEDLDRAEADDVDTESEDDRQTVVEVDDEIDEDVWDYDRPEESNDQSECEEAEREMDRYADKSAKDWNEDGAVGGAYTTTGEIQGMMEDGINIDRMYDDAVKNTEESGIQKDYDKIVKAMNEEENKNLRNSSEPSDTISVRSEELLDEILREDEERYKQRSSRRDKIEASRTFIEYEANAGASLQNGVTSNSISSTRLRSRYGIGPSPAYRNYENLDEINVDLNYIPKKEYKWRKNFKLDEDGSSQVSDLVEEKDGRNYLVSPDDSKNLEEGSKSCDALFSKTAEEEKTPGDIGYSSFGANFEKTQEEDISESEKIIVVSSVEICEEEEEKSGHRGTTSIIEEHETVSIKTLDETEKDENKETNIKSVCYEESEKLSKKKKTKRRSRKGSKGSVGGEEEEQQGFQIDVDNKNEIQSETGAKKKIKKKKKSSENTSPPGYIRSPSPSKTNTPSATNLDTSLKSLSPIKNFQTAKSQEPAIVEEDSKSPSRLATISVTTKSKSKSPETISKTTGSKDEPSGKGTSPKPQLERNDSTGVYDLIKDGSMYPWF